MVDPEEFAGLSPADRDANGGGGDGGEQGGGGGGPSLPSLSLPDGAARSVARGGREVGRRMFRNPEAPDAAELAENYSLPMPAAHALRMCIRMTDADDVPDSAPAVVDGIRAVVAFRSGGDGGGGEVEATDAPTGGPGE